MNSVREIPLWTLKKTARIAGVFYLTYIVLSILSQLIAKLGFGSPAEIVEVMQTQGARFRLGFMVNMIWVVFFLLAAWALYMLLRPVNKDLALLFLLLNLAGIAVETFSFLELYAGWLLVGSSTYSSLLLPEQLHLQAIFNVDLYRNAHQIAQIFFSTWLFPLGYLVFRSGYLPKFLGVILMVECVAWFMYPLQYFLFPNAVLSQISMIFGFIGEFSLTMWLVIMGAKDAKINTVGIQQ
jgi:hypothetical protein